MMKPPRIWIVDMWIADQGATDAMTRHGCCAYPDFREKVEPPSKIAIVQPPLSRKPLIVQSRLRPARGAPAFFPLRLLAIRFPAGKFPPDTRNRFPSDGLAAIG